MAEKLKLVLKNPVLPLTLRAGFLVLAVFWLRYEGITFFKALIFLLIFLFLYFKPKTNSGKYLISAIVWLMLVLWGPNISGLMGFYVNVVLGALAFIMLGVKNLIILRWQSAYYLLHLVLVVGATSLFLLGSISEVPLFIILFFMFKEFYKVMVKKDPNIINLVASVEAMLLIQAAWVSSFFPTSFLVSASFLVLATFVLHDTLVNYFKETFSKELLVRDLGLFVGLSVLILLMPVWGFQ
ncbi:MAG: hypothetical protein COT89_00175 [Candidatus Colwellbacteria bacterium CG10_big_fil_rev_8_21_14_0_10_42_22]|uniref:Uncharacterized protein n=1 Tax=Candidatus Colwellbacteria bacterium CG10_big_fil_rev_8_21_14_0_10_42_22 TaxID=1974540 RepID=A0A2H0VGQ1_9BACT|nr:MAG: hypothetical protein COT89_00175 [Candidatus Colwellbacteria bacterium CG10_big_fil_rev_8_21_14_0_10_42_22]